MAPADRDFYPRENIGKHKQNKNSKCWIISHKVIVQRELFEKYRNLYLAGENKHQRSVESSLSFLAIISVAVRSNGLARMVFGGGTDCPSRAAAYTRRTAESRSPPVVQYHCAS